MTWRSPHTGRIILIFTAFEKPFLHVALILQKHVLYFFLCITQNQWIFKTEICRPLATSVQRVWRGINPKLIYKNNAMNKILALSVYREWYLEKDQSCEIWEHRGMRDLQTEEWFCQVQLLTLIRPFKPIYASFLLLFIVGCMATAL